MWHGRGQLGKSNVDVYIVETPRALVCSIYAYFAHINYIYWFYWLGGKCRINKITHCICAAGAVTESRKNFCLIRRVVVVVVVQVRFIYGYRICVDATYIFVAYVCVCVVRLGPKAHFIYLYTQYLNCGDLTNCFFFRLGILSICII